MKQFFILIFILFAYSCTDDIVENNNLSSPNTFDVYVTGQYNGQACYWKNNQLILLDNSSLSFSVATKIMLAGNDVYVFGYSTGPINSVFLYWKNGVLTNLNYLLNPNNESIFNVSDMYINGNDLYFCGNSGNTSAASKNICYWKNGLKTILNSNDAGEASRIIVSNNTIYVLSSRYTVPIVSNNSDKGYYKDGVFYSETDYAALYGMVNINNDVYIYGKKDASLSGSNFEGYYKNITNGIITYIPATENVWNLNEDNANLFFDDGINFYKNNTVDNIFHNGNSIDSFKILNNNSFVLSHSDDTNVIFYLDINNTNTMQIDYSNGEFTSLLVVQN